MNNQEVAHLFAAQKRSAAKGSNFRFEGDTLYSYSTPIAKIIAPNVVLLSTHRFSISTSRHQAYARRALSHYKRYYIPSISLASPVKTLVRIAENLHETSLQPRIQPTAAQDRITMAQRAYDDAREIAKIIKYPPPRKKTFTLDNAPRKRLAAETAKLYALQLNRLKDAAAGSQILNEYREAKRLYKELKHYNPNAKVSPPPTNAQIDALQRKYLQNLFNNEGSVERLITLAKQLADTDTPKQRQQRQTYIQITRRQQIANAKAGIPDAETQAQVYALLDRIPKDDAEYATFQELAAKRTDTLRKEAEAKQESAIQQWRSNNESYCPRTPTALLRLSSDRKVVNTSLGANVPAKLAQMVYEIVKECRDTNTPREMNTPLDAYRWLYTNAQGGIVVGCHEIRFEEIEGIYNALYN